MRGVCALVLLTFSSGCASTVHRMDGDFPTAAGVAKSECEKQDWLVVSPTRAEFVTNGVRSERVTTRRVYRIGESPRSSKLDDDRAADPACQASNPVRTRHNRWWREPGRCWRHRGRVGTVM